MNNLILSDRMQKLADYVSRGESAADIGTDHGFIPIYLYTEKISPKVILSDVAEGPLEIAKANVFEFGLSGDPNVSIRLGDGLNTLENAECDDVIIAGMGGELISSILALDIDKSRSFKKLILQPRTMCHVLRRWLIDNDFDITDEKLSLENGHLAELLLVSADKTGNKEIFKSDIDYFVPPKYFENKDPLLDDYLKLQKDRAYKVIENLKESDLSKEDNANRLSLWKERALELERLTSK